MKQATRTFFSTLIAASYTLQSKADRQFCADLMRPIPFVPADADMAETGDLAMIPGARADSIRASILWHEEAIEEEREVYLDEIYGSDDEIVLSRASRLYIRELRAGIKSLKAELAAL